MKCQRCKRDLNNYILEIQNTRTCPFCSSALRITEEKDDIGHTIDVIIEKYGHSILEDSNRMNALLMDYIPRAEKERKLIILVVREGIVAHLKKVVDEGAQQQKFVLDKCVRQLVESVWITEAAARYAVTILATAIGIVNREYVVSNGNLSCSLEARDSLEAEHKGKVFTKDLGLSSKDAVNCVMRECGAIGYKGLAANTNIEELVIPENIKIIYPKAFLNCINLRRIILSDKIEEIGCCAFEGCSSLEEINLNNSLKYKVLNGILIDKHNNSILRAVNTTTDVVSITNGIATICKKSFERSKVRQINIPMTVNKIEDDAFYLTMLLEKFVVDCKNVSYRDIDGVLHNRNGNVLLKYPQGKSGVNYYLEDTVEEIGVKAFSCVKNLNTITFTSKLRKIGSNAFEYCPNIENLILPATVELIGDRAFQYCDKLRSVMLSRSISEIGDCAFLCCSSLETVSIPRNVVKIGNMAFAYCEGLKKVTIQEYVNFIGDGVFEGCKNIEILIKNNPYVETYCRSHRLSYFKI